MSDVQIGEARPSRPNRRNLFIGLGACLVALACLCVVAAIVFAILDPFGWLARFFGGGAGAAAVMPPDVPFYVGADLARLRTEEVDRLIATFAEATDSDVRDLDSVIEEADAEMDSAIGMTITEDVLPWVGQYAGVAVTDLQLDPYSTFEQGAWLAAVEARDRGAADDFLARLEEALISEEDAEFDESEYGGVTLHAFTTPYGEEGAFARSGSYVLIGSNADMLRAAIDARQGESLADSEGFRRASGPLPSDAVVTAYADLQAIADLATSPSMPLSPFSGLYSGGLSSIAFSASLIGEGVRVSAAVAYDPEQLTDSQREGFASRVGPVSIDRRFPEDTFFFMAARGLSEGWREFEESSSQDETFADLLESIRLLEDQVGIDLGDDLFAYLDGEIGVGIGPSDEGLLPETMQIPLGILILAETSQEEPLRATIEDISDQIPQDAGLMVRDTTLGGFDAIELSDPYQGTPALVYGVGDGMLFITTGADLAEAAFEGGASLAENEAYRSTWTSFPSGEAPTLYLNLEGLLGQIRESQSGYALEDFNQSTAILGPVRTVAATGRMTGDYMSVSTFIVFIDWLGAAQ